MKSQPNELIFFLKTLPPLTHNNKFLAKSLRQINIYFKILSFNDSSKLNKAFLFEKLNKLSNLSHKGESPIR